MTTMSETDEDENKNVVGRCESMGLREWVACVMVGDGLDLTCKAVLGWLVLLGPIR
jgi:hypothetical protein